RAPRVAGARARLPCGGLLRAHRHAAFRTCRRPDWCTGTPHARIAGWLVAKAHQQGRLHRAGRIARGDGSARIGRLRAAIGTRSRATGRRCARRLRHGSGGATGLRRRLDMTVLAPNSVQARDIASVVHPQTNLALHLTQGPAVIERGEGIYVFDDSGQKFLDAAAGLWCASLGYANERLAKVAYEQMRRLGHYHFYRHTTNEPGVDLAEALLRIAPVPMSKVLFQCSGSEANDTAIKLVWYYHAAIGKPEKRKIIGRRMGYHGSTSASIS